MPSFFERVRAALAEKGYQVERELGSGGMGVVVLARQVSLDRLVAVKVIRPELHTAIATERFQREAKTLAHVSHPNIVPVYEVDETPDGLPYYTMQYLEGETVAHRLRQGPLPANEVRKLGRDLLAALEAAHTRGIVHRDVKPANVFIVAGSAVLVDFGIAKRIQLPDLTLQSTGDPLTEPGMRPGTRAYWSPEQLGGAEATAGTDLYAAALVIYEAYTGRHWLEAQRLARGAWSGVPRLEARVLKRALAWKPEDRWRDATSFRRRLWHARVWPYQRRVIAIAIGCLILGANLPAWRLVVLGRLSDIFGFQRGPTRIQITRFATTSSPAERWLGDSISCGFADALGRYPDLAVRGPCERPWGRFQRKTRLEGAVNATGDTIRVRAGPAGGRWQELVSFPAMAWQQGVADLAADSFDSLLGPGRALEPSLPAAILPKGPAARGAFLAAEHLFAQARWGEAYAAYGRAAAADTTCWICDWRHVEVGRWLSLPEDSDEVARYEQHRSLFPAQYQWLIDAEARPLDHRIADLEAGVRRWPEFFFGRFRLADELLHRGPLVGHARREAVPPFNDLLEGRADFGPAWEHLAWRAIADGDSEEATHALVQLRSTGPSSDAFTAQIRALLDVAFAWRFLDSARAHSVTVEQVRKAEAAGATALDAGARYLPHFDAQLGALELGRILEARPQLARSALLAQTFGALGLGRVDSALAVLRRLQVRYGERRLALFADELEAVWLAFDPDSAGRARWPSIRASLAERAALPATAPEERQRAAWMIALVARRLGERDDASVHALLADEPPPRPLGRLLSAVEAASRGDVRQALKLSEPAIVVEAGASDPDPFFRAMLHLLRAEWYQGVASREGARRELVWYQNSDVYRYPVDEPELAEVDWAFGVLARWRVAPLLGGGDIACRAYRDVKRLWASGDPRYRTRADSATRRLTELHCGASL